MEDWRKHDVQQRAQMQQGMQLIRVTGMDGAKAY